VRLVICRIRSQRYPGGEFLLSGAHIDLRRAATAPVDGERCTRTLAMWQTRAGVINPSSRGDHARPCGGEEGDMRQKGVTGLTGYILLVLLLGAAVQTSQGETRQNMWIPQSLEDELRGKVASTGRTSSSSRSLRRLRGFITITSYENVIECYAWNDCDRAKPRNSASIIGMARHGVRIADKMKQTR
jgi:hypothetical protein